MNGFGIEGSHICEVLEDFSDMHFLDCLIAHSIVREYPIVLPVALEY